MLRRFLATCSVLVVMPAGALASAPRFWQLEGANAFLEGEFRATSIDSEGRLRLGPDLEPLHAPGAPNAWALVRGSDGSLYVGTGNEGQLIRIRAGQAETLFDAEELGVHALAVAPDGRVFAGTSPDGAVYAIDPAGRATRFFDPAEKYIWALAFDAAGRLHVATGAEGRIYRVEKDGRSQTLLAASDTHVLALAFDTRGRLFAGSSPEGLVYRLEPDGRAFVVLDSPFREIRALAAGDDGSVDAAAIDGAAPQTLPGSQGATVAQKPTADLVAEVAVTESFALAAAAGTVAPTAQPSGPRGAVLRIHPSGDIETLWTSAEDVPQTLARIGQRVLIGTGNKGKIYRVDRRQHWTLLASAAAEQVTSIAAGGGTPVVVATSNPARVYLLDEEHETSGTFVSKVGDAESPSRWGRLSWVARTPPRTRLEVQARLGNTPQPDATWTDWATVASDASGGFGSGEWARYAQVRLTLSGNGSTPEVESLTLAFLPRNQPPELAAITIHPPGEVFQRPIPSDPEILGLDPAAPTDRGASARAASAPPSVAMSRKVYQRGLRTISWQAEDPNGDSLAYDVQFRAVGEQCWQPLQRGLREPVLTWDTSSVPNGRYVVRVVASDAAGNPPAAALTAFRDSASFPVDNTPPTLRATADANRPGHVSVAVQDDGPLRLLEMAVDGGAWAEVPARDGITDSPREEYQIVLPGPPNAASRRLLLRAADLLGNVGALQVEIPAREP